ncbi:hypothetical protein HRbin22_01673 [Candidatus Thermoflexus japonica]|uniref:Uncharacterized protein n=1 Tax=Candidatus Thermoflexus japonica TaxID=2035417 RepID=A0A2H5Y7L8_9CHLR|nr:hypothetical protein HRbin22_01673 [Candidatus Thermoflexus japonica]
MSIWKEIYEYLTYEHYGKRRWRPAAYGLLLTLAVAAGMLLAGGIFALQAPRGARPAPTLPPHLRNPARGRAAGRNGYMVAITHRGR